MISHFNIKPTLRLLWNGGSKWSIANLVLVILQGLIPVTSIYLLKLIVDAVTLGLQLPDKTAALERIAMLVGIAFGVAVLGVVIRVISRVVNNALAELLSDYVYELLHAKSIEIDLACYDNSDYYDVLHQAQSQAIYRPHNIMLEMIAIAQCSISLVAIITLLFSLHWSFAFILFLLTIPGIAVRLRHANKSFRWMRKSTPTQRYANYMSQLLTQDSHAKEVRLFNLGSFFQARFRSLRRQLRRERLELSISESIQEFVTELGATIGVYGALGFIAYRTVQGQISIGELVMYHQAFQRGQEFLDRILRNLALLYEDNLFLSNLYKFLELKPQVLQPVNPLPIPRPMQSGIVFDRVSFDYPNSSRRTLKEISLTIRPGEVIALVGENGSGKTTLIKLLCRLYDPTDGRITMDGVDLRQFDTEALRREISVIFQDYARYHLTAQENIWFGDVSLSPEDEKVTAAAYRSGAHDVITRLPRSYATVLGKWFEEGEELSTGQWQKIALARAFLRNSQLIVLDEPTSAMDPKAEYEVFKTFRELLQNQAAILISHRLSTVKMADRIYVLEQGELIESGSHSELMRLGGAYAQMFERQAEQYCL